MTGDDIEPAVTNPELLSNIAAESFAPAVNADGVAAERQLVAALLQPVAQVVVVSISHAFVEQADLVERTGAIRRVAGADVVDETTAKPRVPILEVASRRSRPESGLVPGEVVSLRRRNLGIREGLRQFSKPASTENNVLIDLTDDRMKRVPDSLVDRRGGPVPWTMQEPHDARAGQLLQQSHRSVGAAVINGDDFKRPPVLLGHDACQRTSQRVAAIQDGDDEGHACWRRSHALILHDAGCSATTVWYSDSSSVQMVSEPNRWRATIAAARARLRHPCSSSITASIAAARVPTSP